MPRMEKFNLQSLYHTFLYSKIAFIVQFRLKRQKHSSKLFKRFFFKFLFLLKVFWNGKKIVATHNGIKIHSSSACHKRKFSLSLKRIESPIKILLKTKDIVFRVQSRNVYKMIRNLPSIHEIFRQIFSTSKIKTFIHLP